MRLYRVRTNLKVMKTIFVKQIKNLKHLTFGNGGNIVYCSYEGERSVEDSLIFVYHKLQFLIFFTTHTCTLQKLNFNNYDISINHQVANYDSLLGIVFFLQSGPVFDLITKVKFQVKLDDSIRIPRFFSLVIDHKSSINGKYLLNGFQPTQH